MTAVLAHGRALPGVIRQGGAQVARGEMQRVEREEAERVDNNALMDFRMHSIRYP